MITADVRPPTPRVQARRESEESLGEGSVSPRRRNLPAHLPPGIEAAFAPAPLVSPSLTMSMTPRGGGGGGTEALPQGDAAGGRRFTFSEGGSASAAALPPPSALPRQQAEAAQRMPLINQPVIMPSAGFPHMQMTAALMVITTVLALLLPIINAVLGAVLAFGAPQCVPQVRGRIPFRTYGRGVFAMSFLLSLAQIVGALLLAFLPQSKGLYKGGRNRILLINLAAVIACFLSMVVLYLYGIALLVRAQDVGFLCPAGARNAATGIVVLGMMFTPIILACLGVLFFERANVKVILSILTMTAAPLFSPTAGTYRGGVIGAGPSYQPGGVPRTPALETHQFHQQPLPSPVTLAAKAAADAHYASVMGTAAPSDRPLPPRSSPLSSSNVVSAAKSSDGGIALSRAPSFRRSSGGGGVGGAGGTTGGEFGAGHSGGPVGGGQPILLPASPAPTTTTQQASGGSSEGQSSGFDSFSSGSQAEGDNVNLLGGKSKASNAGQQGDLLDLGSPPRALPATTLDPSPHSAR